MLSNYLNWHRMQAFAKLTKTQSSTSIPPPAFSFHGSRMPPSWGPPICSMMSNWSEKPPNEVPSGRPVKSTNTPPRMKQSCQELSVVARPSKTKPPFSTATKPSKPTRPITVPVHATCEFRQRRKLRNTDGNVGWYTSKTRRPYFPAIGIQGKCLGCV